MKTESEIYKACIDAGLQAGDIVRMSDGRLGYVHLIDLPESGDLPGMSIIIGGTIDSNYYFNRCDAKQIQIWPTHYARPTFVEYQGGGINGCFTLYREENKGPCTHEITYPTPPDPKTSAQLKIEAQFGEEQERKRWMSIEERIAALEAKVAYVMAYKAGGGRPS